MIAPKNYITFNPVGSAKLDYVEIGRKILVITATNAETFSGGHLGFAV
jgi:hypothetical protein